MKLAEPLLDNLFLNIFRILDAEHCWLLSLANSKTDKRVIMALNKSNNILMTIAECNKFCTLRLKAERFNLILKDLEVDHLPPIAEVIESLHITFEEIIQEAEILIGRLMPNISVNRYIHEELATYNYPPLTIITLENIGIPCKSC